MRDKKDCRGDWGKGNFLENRNSVKFLGKKKKFTVIFKKFTALKIPKAPIVP
jgi:hypothetical protein